MIVYKFPKQNFRASEGYTNIQVIKGKLEFEEKPGKDTLALIKKHDGKQILTSERKETKLARRTVMK